MIQNISEELDNKYKCSYNPSLAELKKNYAKKYGKNFVFSMNY
jgi:hypothetical protein